MFCEASKTLFLSCHLGRLRYHLLPLVWPRIGLQGSSVLTIHWTQSRDLPSTSLFYQPLVRRIPNLQVYRAGFSRNGQIMHIYFCFEGLFSPSFMISWVSMQRVQHIFRLSLCLRMLLNYRSCCLSFSSSGITELWHYACQDIWLIIVCLCSQNRSS